MRYVNIELVLGRSNDLEEALRVVSIEVQGADQLDAFLHEIRVDHDRQLTRLREQRNTTEPSHCVDGETVIHGLPRTLDREVDPPTVSEAHYLTNRGSDDFVCAKLPCELRTVRSACGSNDASTPRLGVNDSSETYGS